MSAIDISQEEYVVSDAQAVLAHHAKSFRLASLFLPVDRANDAAVLYRFCRLIDDSVDEAENKEEAHRNIEQISKELYGECTPRMEIESFLAVSERLSIPLETADALMQGVISDLGRVRVKTDTELALYSYRVAGVVGRMMCGVLGVTSERAIPYAIDLGIAMQITNICRDVLEDAQMGRRYIPGDWVNNMSPEEIVEASNNPNSDESILIQDGIKRLLDMAEIFYRSGHHGLAYLPFRAHLSISVAAKVYRQIGVQIDNSGLNWYDGRQSTSKLSKIICTIKATFNLLTRASIRKKSHNTSLHSKLEGLPFVG